MKSWSVTLAVLAITAVPVMGYADATSPAAVTAAPVAEAPAKVVKHHKKKAKQHALCSTCEYHDAMDKMHKGMMKVSYTGDTDLDFVTSMIPHHQGAVEMANVELKYGKDEEMLKLAHWIVQEQTEEIGFMDSWSTGRINPNAPVKEAASTAEYKNVMEVMHHGVMIDYTGNADVDFARGMIPHHQGAVDMATVELHKGKNADIHKLADGIFNSQSKEITVMQKWLDAHPVAAKPAVVKKKHHHKAKPVEAKAVDATAPAEVTKSETKK